MSEENKTKVRRLLEEGFGQGKVDVVDEVLHSDFVCYDPNSEAGEIRGADTIKGEIEYFRTAAPDLTYTVEDQVAEGDKVVSRYRVSGTHQGEFFGFEQDARSVQLTHRGAARRDEFVQVLPLFLGQLDDVFLFHRGSPPKMDHPQDKPLHRNVKSSLTED